ncbi:MAG TPA: YqcC family protein [Xanthomonadales bacterium]|nr:YqcC family protein [Xanthomonadales bacterium]
MSSSYLQVADLLLRIEQELRQQDLWHADRPSDEALNSVQPFCYDTLCFTEWLQFIFLPRMKVIIENGLALPPSCDIAPMAEEAFKQLSQNTDELLVLLIECDRAIVGHSK